MKLFKYIFTFAAALLLLSACESFLDEVPRDRTSDEIALKTTADFDNQLKDCYAVLKADGYDGFLLLMPEITADNLILNQSGRTSYSSFYYWDFSAQGTYGNIFNAAYNGILGANHVITRLEGQEIPDEQKALLAEAYALRAWFHFDLVRIFGKNYATASSTDLGVPYKEETEATKPARNTVKEVYTKITGDLDKAFALMPDNYNETYNARIGKKALNALAARVYLTMAGNTNDAAILQKVIDYTTVAITGDGTDIASTTDFAKIWTGTNQISEVILRLAIIDTDGQVPGNFYGQSASGTDYKNEYNCTYSFYELFQKYGPNTDVRQAAYLSTDTYDSEQYIGVKKYRNRTGTPTANRVDIILIRTSEMYLTRAEANIRMGNITEAQTDLAYVLAKRYTIAVPTPVSETDVKNEILLQRRLDIAFEGHRWFDLKRLSQDLVRDNKGDKKDGTGIPSPFLTKFASDPYWALPIAKDEMDANPNMVQNVY